MKRFLILILALTLAVSGTVNVLADRLGENGMPAGLYSDSKPTGILPVFPDGVTGITAKTVPWYNNKPESGGDFTLYFMNGAEDLPFINVEDLPDLLYQIYNGEIDIGNRYTADILGSALIIRRENGALAIIDFIDQTIYFSNRSVFLSPAGMTDSMDISMHEVKSNSDAGSFLNMTVGYIRQGSASTFPLAEYQIPMILQDYTGYIPLQTVSDLFLSDNYYMLLYNGESLITAAHETISDPGQVQFAAAMAESNAANPDLNGENAVGLTEEDLAAFGLTEEDMAALGWTEDDLTGVGLTDEDLIALGWTEDDLTGVGLTDEDLIALGLTGDGTDTPDQTGESPADAALTEEGPMTRVYYTGKSAMKSDALTQLTYNELCMALDSFYGLQEEHKISSFDQLFLDTGLIGRLLNNDPAETYLGLAELTGSVFSDQHSAPAAPSHMLGERNVFMEAQELLGPSMVNIAPMFRMASACGKYYPDGIPGYEEIGDTAYITFDTFSRDTERTYRGIDCTANRNDVLELLLYSCRQVRREGSPVRNVVLDLSQNVGGMVDTAVMTVSAFLGSSLITLEDTFSGTNSTIMYDFDGNANGVFYDPDDFIGSENFRLYCLISPVSFSSGNLVPAMLKASQQVTIIGQRSGGGACVVLPLCTADGNMFCTSGHQKISTSQNGIFYSVDEGVEPSFVISDPDHFYDREYLTEWIHQLP